MNNGKNAQRPNLIVDVIVVFAIILCCFLYMEHYSQIQNEANTILMHSVEDLNSSLASSEN